MNTGKWFYFFEGLLMLFIIALFVGYIFLIYKLCCMVQKNTELQNGKKTATAIIITVILCWPVAIGQVIYMMINWGDSTEVIVYKMQPPQQAVYPKPYKDDYERWKEKRLKEQQKKEQQQQDD